MGSSEIQKMQNTPQGLIILEEMKNNKRSIERAGKQIDRERTKLEMKEQKALFEIKDLTKKGKVKAAKILIADLIRRRKLIENYYMMKLQLKSITLQLSNIDSNVAVTNALRTAASTMAHSNQTFNTEEIKCALKQYTKGNAKMEMKKEMISDTIDIVTEVNEKEVDDVYNQLCEELNLEITGKIGKVPIVRNQKSQLNEIVI